MNSKISILIILGTARQGRRSEKVSRAVFNILSERPDIKVQLVDVKQYIYGRTIPPSEDNQRTQPWRSLVDQSDGFLIVTPEYNHGYPGELKILLDQAYKEFHGKPVVVCGTSKGVFGGTRAIENLLPVLRALGLVVSQYSINVPKVESFPDDPVWVDDKFKEKVIKAADVLVKTVKQSDDIKK